jgi:hypothetical protein
MTNIDDLHYYYHGDQDDLVCGDCAKNLKHSDTAYAGMTSSNALKCVVSCNDFVKYERRR